MEALREGRHDILRGLADRLGPDRLNALAPDLMERAFVTGDETLLEALITRGLLRRPRKAKADSSLASPWDSPLRAAVGIGSLSLLQLILDHCPEARSRLAECVSEEGHTLLFEAASAPVAHWLMDRGVDPDHRSATGETALAHRLSRAPSDDSQRLAEQSSAVALAERCELSDRVVIALCVELSLDNPEVLKAIVNRGVSPDVTLSTGEPVLVAAAARGLESSAVFLAQHGADPYAITPRGDCAVDLAMRQGKPSLAQSLSEAFNRWEDSREETRLCQAVDHSLSERSATARL